MNIIYVILGSILFIAILIIFILALMNIPNFIRKIHGWIHRDRYYFYHRDEYYLPLCHHPEERYHFICKKCGKTVILKQDDINEWKKYYIEKINKEIAFGEDISNFNNYRWSLKEEMCADKYTDTKYYYEYSGKLAFYMELRFKDFRKSGIKYWIT